MCALLARLGGCDDVPSDALLIHVARHAPARDVVIGNLQRMVIAVDSAFYSDVGQLPAASGLVHCGWLVRAATFAVLAEKEQGRAMPTPRE